MLTDKQFGKIGSLIKSDRNWDNNLGLKENVDCQRAERKIKELDIVQADNLIKDLEDENWERVSLILNN